MLHGESDMVVPFVNGKAVYDRAQSVGLSSTMITMESSGHVDWDDILTNYFTGLTTSLYYQVT